VRLDQRPLRVRQNLANHPQAPAKEA
jgi:hypothetical protein